VIFPNEDPIGKHVLLWKGQGNADAEVIGVVGDSRERGLASGPTGWRCTDHFHGSR
jgi:hypothetical protein